MTPLQHTLFWGSIAIAITSLLFWLDGFFEAKSTPGERERWADETGEW